MSSTRLPGKALADIAGKPMLERVVERTRRIAGLREVVVATAVSANDERIVKECRRLDTAVFRGSEEDVLDRYWQACRRWKADAVVRICSDCPLIDAGESTRVVDAFVAQQPDLAANDLEPSYPVGLGTEVISARALETAWREAVLPYERQHVAPFIYRHPERFQLLNVAAPGDYSRMRWTVDTREDLEFARAVYTRLNRDGLFDWRAVLDLVEREPELAALNAKVRQKAIEEG